MTAVPADSKPIAASSALTEVLGALSRRYQAQREADPEYRDLWDACQDGGRTRAVLEAERKMRTIALDLLKLLGQDDGRPADADLLAVVYGLPLAFRLLKQEIQEQEGLECCADKARLVLRKFLAERLGV